jgi:parvulin-like peptidyl-prolyl isomerase
MKFTWKQAVSALLAIALMLSFAGCAKKSGTASNSDATASDAQFSDKELAQVAVKIGKDLTITKGDVLDRYNSLIEMYSYYGMAAPTDATDIEAMQDNAVSSLVSEKVQIYEAEQMGIVLTEAEKADVTSKVDAQMESYLSSFRSQAQTEGATDVDARANEIFQEQLTAANMDMDIEGFRAYLTDGYQNEALMAALKTKVTEGVTATDDEVKAYFDNLLATQTDAYTTTPADYLNAAEGYQKSGGDPMLVTPEGYVRVRSITVSPAEDVSQDYTTLKSDMESIANEYGAAALNALADKYTASGKPATDTSVTISAAEINGGDKLVNDYLTKKAAADALYEEYVKDARAKANEAYAALQSGTSFTDAMKKYGEDSIYTDYPTFVDTGLLMYVGGTDSVWDAKIVDAVKQLKDGEYTAVIQIDNMFHIIQLVGAEPAATKTLDQVTDEIKAQVIATNADKLWSDTLDKWEKDTSIVTYNKDVYSDIGK